MAREGEGDALDRVLARCLPRVRRWAHGRLPAHLRSRCDTRDLLQDVALHAFQRVPTFDPQRPGAFDAYLRQGVMNRIRDEVRREARTPRSEPLDDVVASDTPCPFTAALADQTGRRYREALSQLSPRDQRLVIGRAESGWGPTTAAKALGFPSSAAAGMATRRALTRLALLMTPGTPKAHGAPSDSPTKTKKAPLGRPGSAASAAGTGGWRDARWPAPKRSR